MALALCLTSLGACDPGQKTTEPPTFGKSLGSLVPLEKEHKGVSFSIEDVTPEGAFIQFGNRDNVSVYSGAGWDLFVSTDNGYKYVHFNKDIEFPMILFLEPLDRYIDFVLYYGGLAPGSYRFVYLLIFPEVERDYENLDDKVYIYADFTVK